MRDFTAEWAGDDSGNQTGLDWYRRDFIVSIVDSRAEVPQENGVRNDKQPCTFPDKVATAPPKLMMEVDVRVGVKQLPVMLFGSRRAAMRT